MHNLQEHGNQSLWIGLESYNESESNIFFGRDEEIQQLSNDIFHNIQTVIYGPSGTGKTSIIRAGVFKVARENGYFPVYVRLLHGEKKEKSYYRQIIETIESEAKIHEIDIEQTIHYIKKEGENEICGSLWEYFHCNEFWTKENYPIIPLIVIDQFEEIFTLSQDRLQQADFFEQISDLCDNKLPSYIKDYINNRDNERVEYLESANYRFVVSLREDFLARLEELAEKIPALKRNRFSLQCTNEEQALEIIMKPSPGLVSEEIAIQIIERVTGKKYRKDFTIRDQPDILVEPSILSLFCSELDKKRQVRGLDYISDSLIGEFGDNIIMDFYIDCLTNFSDDKIDFLEERLLTADGFRDAVALQNAKRYGFSDMEITSLTDRRLVRIEEWDGTKRVEFTHDVLCKVALTHKQERENQKIRLEEEQKRQLLQEEQEQERTKRNVEYNRKKRATERNVLVHKGRRLIDNALDFGEFRTINGIPLRNPVDKIMAFVRLMTRAYEDYFEDSSDSEFVNQKVFSDPLLNNADVVLSFYKDDESTPTIDGIYSVKLKYEGSLVSDIFFRGKRILADGSLSFDEPIYISGGYCGIHIDYDEKQREVRRTFLDDSGNPIVTSDGYSVIQTEYDEKNNPIKIRYFILKNGKLSAARHLHGNHGYNSIFDKNGNEIERHFVDENEQPTTITSGVYGKRMTYEKDTFRLLTISNIDSKGVLMADKDGYVTDSKVYDEKGLPTLDYYLDEEGKPWETPSGTYGSIDKIDFHNNIITMCNIDEHGAYIEDKDGVQKIVVKINDKRQITELFSVDKNDGIVESEDKTAIQLRSFDELNRLQSVKFLNKDRQFVSGKRFDCNKEGTHIVREYYLSDNGIGQNEDFGVEGIEYSLDGDKNLPILQLFINENKQYKKSSDGFYAIRIWEDEKGRPVKQLYYHVDGTPMANDDGEFGVIVDYLDEETNKITHIDANGNMIENNNGVAFTIRKESSSGVIETSFNLEGMPHANNDLAYFYRDRESLKHGYIDKIHVHNSNNELIEFWQPRLADSGWEPIKCMFNEITYDENGRPLSQYFKDVNGQIVGDSAGDSYTIWEYNDEDNLEFCSLYNTKNELSQRKRTKRDERGRVLEQSYLNKDNTFAKLERGYSSETIEYDDEERKKTITIIDHNGNVCNDKEGFARRVYQYDQFGRIIAQESLTLDDVEQCKSGICYYIDYGRKEGSRYLYKRNSYGDITPFEDGSIYKYTEDNTDGRTSMELYLDGNKKAISDEDGDYGLVYEYDDEKRLTIITFLDENGLPHNNNLGYGIIHVYKDEEGRDIKRMHYTVEGTPVVLPQLIGCYGESYEYPNEHNRIVGYLNENGDITTNSHGYAYREECLNPETGVRRVFYYDKDRNNTQSLEDEAKEFGYAIDFEDNWIHVVSLGKDGQVTNNAAGYARRAELYEEGKLRFYKFIDADNKPMADSAGDYGTEILRSDDGSMVRYVSLNAKYERHINDYGYCYCDIITDIAGEHIRIYRDMEENQVLPKQRFVKSLKTWLSKFKKKEKALPVYNCRQIGAIFDCILGNVEGKGLMKEHGLTGTYVLLQYDSWKLGDDTEELGKIISDATNQSKHLVLLPVTLKGSLLQAFGEIIELDFPAGQIGMRFKDWGINMDTLRIIFEKQQVWEDEKLS